MFKWFESIFSNYRKKKIQRKKQDDEEWYRSLEMIQNELIMSKDLIQLLTRDHAIKLKAVYSAPITVYEPAWFVNPQAPLIKKHFFVKDVLKKLLTILPVACPRRWKDIRPISNFIQAYSFLTDCTNNVYLPVCLLDETLSTWLINPNVSLQGGEAKLSSLMARSVLAHEVGHFAHDHIQLYRKLKEQVKRDPESALKNNKDFEFIITDYHVVPLLTNDIYELEADKFAVDTGNSLGLIVFLSATLLYVYTEIILNRIKEKAVEKLISSLVLRIENILQLLYLPETTLKCNSFEKFAKSAIKDKVVSSLWKDNELLLLLGDDQPKKPIDRQSKMIPLVYESSIEASLWSRVYAQKDPIIRAYMHDCAYCMKYEIIKSLLAPDKKKEKLIPHIWDKYEELLYQWQYLCYNNRFDQDPDLLEVSEERLDFAYAHVEASMKLRKLYR